jgi:hypothetical protein
MLLRRKLVRLGTRLGVVSIGRVKLASLAGFFVNKKRHLSRALGWSSKETLRQSLATAAQQPNQSRVTDGATCCQSADEALSPRAAHEHRVAHPKTPVSAIAPDGYVSGPFDVLDISVFNVATAGDSDQGRPIFSRRFPLPVYLSALL